MNKIRHLAVAALGMSVLALAGCPSAEVDPEPSITFAGLADYAAITEGGEATIYWQTRLADEVQILANGEPISLDACVPNIGDGTPLEVGPLLGEDADGNDRPDDDPDSCLLTGALQVSPDEFTTYTVRALRGEGDCSRRDGVGDLVNPGQCEEWMVSPIQVDVLAAASAAFDETGPVTVPAGEASVDFTVSNAADVAVGILDDSVDPAEIVPCELIEDGGEPSAEALCTYTFDVDTATGTATVLDLQEDTTLILEAANGAEDALGDAEATIDLVVSGT